MYFCDIIVDVNSLNQIEKHNSTVKLSENGFLQMICLRNVGEIL